MEKLKKFVVSFLMCLLLCTCAAELFPVSEFGTAIEVQAATVKLNKKSVTINRYQSTRLRISGTKAKVTWSSSNKKVATVTSKGIVKGVKKGKATIRAKVNKKTYKCTVTVEEPDLIIPSNVEMKSDESREGYALKGTTATFKMTGTKSKVKWTADDYYSTTRRKVSITSKGVATFKQTGTCRIMAEVNGSLYVCFIYVEDPEISGGGNFLSEGTTYEYSMTNVKRTPKWSIQDGSIASIAANGKKCSVTGIKSGTTYLQASIGGKTFKKKITVRPVFEVSKTSVTCTKQTTVDVYLRDSGTLHFDVQDPTIINCKWNPFDGEKSQLVITPLKAGSTTITVTNTVNSDRAVIYVTVPSSGINNPATPSFQANLYADRSPTLVILLQFTNTGSRPITINGPGVLNNGSINTNMITFDNGFVENTIVQPGKFVNLALVKTNLGYFNVNSSSLYGFYITYDNVKYIAIITYNGQLVRLTKSGYSSSALLGDAGIPDDYIAENLDPIILQQNELLNKSCNASVEVRY